MEAIQGPGLAEAITVARVMAHTSVEVAAGLLTIDEEASVARAAELMAMYHLPFLPVTDAGGHVCGVITAEDVAAWLATR